MIGVSVATGTGQAPRWRLAAVALVLSLTLNVCFIAGAAWTRLEAFPGHDSWVNRLQGATAQLNLDPHQQRAFNRYIGGLREQLVLMHDRLHPLYGDVWQEFASAQPDTGRINRLFDAAGEQRRLFQHDITAYTLGFLATLSPQQRARFVELAHPSQRH